MPKPKNPKKTAKARAWKVFSLYIRHRDSHDGHNARCCCCGTIRPIGEMHAGHFRTRGSSAYLEFEEINVHAQCPPCNTRGAHNAQAKYYRFMCDQYGRDHTDQLLDTRETISRRVGDFEALEEYYSQALAERGGEALEALLRLQQSGQVRRLDVSGLSRAAGGG